MAATNRARAKQPTRPAPDPEPGETPPDAPEILRLSGAPAKPGKRVVLFYIGSGKDQVTGSIPETVPASLHLEWLHRLATTTYSQAIDWAFTELLGAEAYAALRSCGDLADEDLAGISRKITTKLNDAGTGPKE